MARIDVAYIELRRNSFDIIRRISCILISSLSCSESPIHL